MNNFFHRRSDCRGCGSHDMEPVFSLKPSPIGDAYVAPERISVQQPSYPIDLHMCRQCGLSQIVDVIDPEVLYGECSYVTASSPEVTEHFRLYADSVIERGRLNPGSLVVDLGSHHGSNDGVLLRRFRERGMRVLSVEPAAHIAAQATAGGIETIGKSFAPDLARQMVTDYGHADVIAANNVIANVDDLMSWVNGVNELLASEGVFVFESIYLADLLQNMVFDFIYHEHLSVFSVKPVQALFEGVGLELVAVQRVPTKGGSLRYFVQRPGGPMAKNGTVDELLALEDNMGLYRKETFSAFADKVNSLKEKTRKFLVKARSEGKSIAGFGACVTGTTLIYHFEIGDCLDYLVDDNPVKQGRFSPGLHLPVLPSAALYERKPDFVLVLAWRFAETFVKKNRAYLQNGGRIVIPVPEFKIAGESA